jgi:hypothetical protein
VANRSQFKSKFATDCARSHRVLGYRGVAVARMISAHAGGCRNRAVRARPRAETIRENHPCLPYSSPPARNSGT